MGQKIAKSAGFISCPVHSPISGKVKKLEEHIHPIGALCLAIVIENDGEDTRADELEKHDDYTSLKPEDFQKIAREAGLVGMGGAAFPTSVKLSPPEDKNIDTVIINGAECEPYLTADHRLMLEYADDIVVGTKMIMQTLEPDRCIIAIEDNKPDAYEKMVAATEGEDKIEVAMLKTKYPQGAEKQLIKTLTGRDVPSGGLPFDIGAYVQNVGTAKALKDAVIDGIPLIERVVTVAGSAVNTPLNLLVRVGTKLSDLLDACDSTEESVGKIIMGGPMMGLAQPTLDMPVLKATSGVLFLTEQEAHLPQERACLSCGRCVVVCPANLMPIRIALYSEHEDFDKAEEEHAMDCIECGSCSYVCPSKRKLVHYIKWAKEEIQKKRRKAAADE